MGNKLEKRFGKNKDFKTNKVLLNILNVNVNITEEDQK